MVEEMKRCPFCGEEILAIAIKCKHCGSDLNGSEFSQSRSIADYGVLLLAIPIATTIFIWLWVPSMNLLDSPSSTMVLLMLITIIGTAIVAAMEASKAGMVSDRKKGTYSPTAWFFIITMIWIVGYPVYLFKRKHYGLENRLTLGILVALVFIGSSSLMNSAIEDRKAEFRGTLEQMHHQFESLEQ